MNGIKRRNGIIIGVISVSIGIFLMMSHRTSVNIKKIMLPIGTVNNSITSKNSSNQVIGIDAKIGDNLRVEYSSKIKGGNLSMKLYLDGKVKEDFDTDVKGKKEILINENGNYELWVEYKDFIGDFKVEVYN